MQITIQDNVYEIDNISDEKIKLETSVLIAKINHHRLCLEGSQILVNTFETRLGDVLKPRDEALVEPTRARDEKGHYIADDPSTPDVIEAWEGGKKPSKSKSS